MEMGGAPLERREAPLRGGTGDPAAGNPGAEGQVQEPGAATELGFVVWAGGLSPDVPCGGAQTAERAGAEALGAQALPRDRPGAGRAGAGVRPPSAASGPQPLELEDFLKKQAEEEERSGLSLCCRESAGIAVQGNHVGGCPRGKWGIYPIFFQMVEEIGSSGIRNFKNEKNTRKIPRIRPQLRAKAPSLLRSSAKEGGSLSLRVADGGCWARTGSQTMVRLPARLQTHLSRLFSKLSCFKSQSRNLVLGTIGPL